VSEIVTSVFATTDLLFSSQTLRAKRKGEILSINLQSLTGPVSPTEMAKLPLGTILYTQIIDQLWSDDETGLKPIYLKSMSDSLHTVKPTEALLSRLKDQIVPDVRKVLLDMIGESSSSKQRVSLTKKVEELKYLPPVLVQGFESVEGALIDFPPNFSRAVVANAFYKPIDNEFSVLQGFLLGNTSLFGQLFIVAHEMGHSVDPCLIFDSFKESEYWNPSLLQEIKQTLANIGIPEHELFSIDSFDDTFSCKLGSEIGESMADAIASEILGRYLNSQWSQLDQDQRITAVAQSFRPFRCGLIKPDDSFAPHLNVLDRYNEIILKNKKVREYLSCK
jgi:hypothetical protein